MVESLQKVSIVLPTYNGARYIRQSIDSCLNQTYKNIEFIIVDDGSKDETPDIIRSYKDDRIKYIRHEKNRGLPNALNTGFEKATGEYLTWTSDDNHYARDAIEKMLSFIKSNKSSFVYCDFYRLNDNDPSYQKIDRLPDTLVVENGNRVGPCFIYSREVMNIIGDYDPSTVLVEDYDYWIRVSKKFSMSHLNEPLYFFRSHEGSLTSRFLRQYDIQIASLLIRVSNDITDVEHATELFINLIVEKNTALMSEPHAMAFLFNKCLTLKRMVSSLLYRILARIKFSKEINDLLKDFKIGNISFEIAKLSLKDIIKRRLI